MYGFGIPDEKLSHHEEHVGQPARRVFLSAQQPQMFVLMWMTAVASFFGIPFLTFIPYFAKIQLNAGESGLGWLLACSGLGAVLGAVTVACLA